MRSILRGTSYGAERIRTVDLLGAIQALSHLSYCPLNIFRSKIFKIALSLKFSPEDASLPGKTTAGDANLK